MEGEVVKLSGGFESLVKGFSDKSERGILRGSLRRTAQQVLVKAAKKNLQGIKAGRHKKSVTVKTTVTPQVAKATVGAKKGTSLAKLGHLFERGTRPHTIRIKDRKVLVANGIFMGRSVEHPGTRPRPWLNPALEDNTQQAVAKFGELIVEEVKKAAAKGKK